MAAVIPTTTERGVPKGKTCDIMKTLPSETLVPTRPRPTTYSSLVNKHKRAGSTGTTGDESYTTDEEDVDEPECSIKQTFEHVNIVRNGIFAFDDDQHTNESLSSSDLRDDLSSTHDDDCDILPENTCIQSRKVRSKSSEHDEAALTNGISIRKKTNPQFIKDKYTNGSEHSHDNSLENGDKDKISWESLSSESDSTKDFTEIGSKEEMLVRLQEELRSTQKELQLREEEVNRLSRIRSDVEAELEDLTASLFQEAHTMVREANINQAAAEKSLKESEMKVEVLTAEVSALKTLVLTSTPSCPNPHLHPQISPRGSKDDSNSFSKKHHRSPSHFNLKYGRENSPPDSPIKELRAVSSLGTDAVDNKEGFEVDPVILKEFLAWKQNPKIDKADPFVARVYEEDIALCLQFNNTELTKKVEEAVDLGNIYIEAINDKTKSVFPKKCALLEVSRLCGYRMKLGDDETWHNISQICRNRIIAVCDFLNYLRYIERGLVKSSAHDVYWEMTRYRKEMVLARLGLPLTT